MYRPPRYGIKGSGTVFLGYEDFIGSQLIVFKDRELENAVVTYLWTT